MFFVQEIQTTGNTANPGQIQIAETQDQAMSIWHGILQYAALSDVEYHTAIVYDKTGRIVASQCYQHPRITAESNT